MTPDQLRSEIARLGTTQVGLSRYLKSNPRTIRRYCSGEIPVPHVVYLALAALKDGALA